MYFWFLKEN